MMAFEVRLRTDDGTEYTLSEELSVGRSDDCDIILPSSKVSRQHARFRVTDGIVSIEDLGSSNGTRLNGNAIDSAQALMNGDSVRIDAYTLTVSIAPAPSVTDAANVSPPRDSYAPGPASSADEPPVAETTLAREPEPEPEPEPQPAHGPEADAVLEPEPDPEPEPAAEPAAEGAAPASRMPLYVGGAIALGIVIVAAALLL